MPAVLPSGWHATATLRSSPGRRLGSTQLHEAAGMPGSSMVAACACCARAQRMPGSMRQLVVPLLYCCRFHSSWAVMMAKRPPLPPFAGTPRLPVQHSLRRCAAWRVRQPALRHCSLENGTASGAANALACMAVEGPEAVTNSAELYSLLGRALSRLNVAVSCSRQGLRACQQ